MNFLYEHSIDVKVKEKIQQELNLIEKKFNVHILYACESGSRGWGFASSDSDYDVRFIYVHKLPWYLTVDHPRDVIELPIDDELDISGWELRKTLQLFAHSNPTLFEWLSSPIVYRKDEALTHRLQTLCVDFYKSLKGRWHYLGMAKNNFRGYLKGEKIRLKKYLYVLRPILAIQWIDAGKGIPPMRFADLAQAMITDQLLKAEINTLLKIKMASGEAQYGEPFPAIQAFIEHFFEQQNIPPEYKLQSVKTDLKILDQILFDAIIENND